MCRRRKYNEYQRYHSNKHSCRYLYSGHIIGVFFQQKVQEIKKKPFDYAKHN